jgi:hypothetical protein
VKLYKKNNSIHKDFDLRFSLWWKYWLWSSGSDAVYCCKWYVSEEHVASIFKVNKYCMANILRWSCFEKWSCRNLSCLISVSSLTWLLTLQFVHVRSVHFSLIVFMKFTSVASVGNLKYQNICIQYLHCMPKCRVHVLPKPVSNVWLFYLPQPLLNSPNACIWHFWNWIQNSLPEALSLALLIKISFSCLKLFFYLLCNKAQT